MMVSPRDVTLQPYSEHAYLIDVCVHGKFVAALESCTYGFNMLPRFNAGNPPSCPNLQEAITAIVAAYNTAEYLSFS